MNNETHKMAGISALPLLIILGLIFGAGYLLLRGDVDLDLFKQKNSLEMRRLEGFPVKITVKDPEMDKQRVVIRSEEELVSFLASIDTEDELSVGEKVDFEKEILIGVATEAFENDGYSVKIKKIYIDKEEDKLLVSSLITEPGDNCVTTEGTIAGVDIVAVDKTDLYIDFETLRSKEICKN